MIAATRKKAATKGSDIQVSTPKCPIPDERKHTRSHNREEQRHPEGDPAELLSAYNVAHPRTPCQHPINIRAEHRSPA
jgi:hypothetical protein